MEAQTLLAAAVAGVGAIAFAASRLPAFRQELRRNIGLAVVLTSFIVVLLAVQLVIVGFDLRSSAVEAGAEALLPKWNGLILGAILLLLVGSLAFLFSLGVLVWSFASGGQRVRPRTGVERPPRPDPDVF